MVEKGYDVVIACRVDKNIHCIESTGARVIPLKKWERGSLNVFREMQALLESFQIYIKEKPDIVHHIAQKPVFYGSIVSIFLGLIGHRPTR